KPRCDIVTAAEQAYSQNSRRDHENGRRTGKASGTHKEVQDRDKLQGKNASLTCRPTIKASLQTPSSVESVNRVALAACPACPLVSAIRRSNPCHGPHSGPYGKLDFLRPNAKK